MKIPGLYQINLYAESNTGCHVFGVSRTKLKQGKFVTLENHSNPTSASEPSQLHPELECSPPSTEVPPTPETLVTSTDTVPVVPSRWRTLQHNWVLKGRIVLMLCSPGIFVVPVAAQLFPDSVSLPQSPAQHQTVSRTDYELLKLGMTLTDAQATLGRAIEVSRDETAATYKWVNSDGSAITAVFKNDRLASKEQSGLQQ